MTEVTQFIDGRAVVGEGDTVSVMNPATDRQIARMPEASVAQVGLAVQAARRSFDAGIWSGLPVPDRQAVLRRAAQAIRDNATALTDLQVAEGGMTRDAVARQVAGAAGWFDYYADFLSLEKGELFRQLGGATTLVERVPIGVCALFSPWNVPVGLSAIKMAPALAAGNSIILKPSEETPLAVRFLVDLIHQAGLPDGVLNCVNGRGQATGAALAQHPGIDMISFTGGHVGGRAVAVEAARRHLPCVMELGGKSATIVFADADMERALEGALAAIFSVNGEACLAGSRILVDEAIADDFIAAFCERARAIRVGDPTKDGVQMGPMVSARHRETVLGFFQGAGNDGDTVLCGGAAPELGGGYFLRPGAIRVASSGSRVWREEVFGPVAAIRSFASEDEAVALANDSDFGLSGYLWTQDIGRAMRVSARICTGTVVINSAFQRDLNAPFGGFKGSGVGREGGAHSWQNFTEAKTTIIQHG